MVSKEEGDGTNPIMSLYMHLIVNRSLKVLSSAKILNIW